jgi:methylmalonyl-CoA mutase N-terminal domain/subunit
MNNIVRVAYQALAAVLGGTQSLHTNGFDEALALPTEDSATLALRTQQVLGYETGLDGVVDPLAGSWYVEALTDRIEREARALIEEVDRLGGAARAIEKGFYQEAIARSAYAHQQAQESGALTVVGVNRFTDDSAPPAIEIPNFPELEARQRERLAAVRARRDAGAVERALGAVAEAGAGKAPLVAPIIDAVRVRATLGEISDRLRGVWGTFRPAG